jgi:UPF0271 protein
MDLNADLAEGTGPQGWAADAALLDVVTSANIACAGHAGDQETMRRACEAALERGVRIGAHPGYEDRENFGRVELSLPVDEVVRQVSEQIALLIDVAAGSGGAVTHVKPHGALYHRASADAELAAALSDQLARVHPVVVVLGLDGSELLKAAAATGLATASEGFADRAYDAAGLLVSRTLPGSVLDAAGAVAQAISIAHDATVTSIDGTEVKVVADSICIHGDTPGALALAKELRAALAASGVSVEAFV